MILVHVGIDAFERFGRELLLHLRPARQAHGIFENHLATMKRLVDQIRRAVIQQGPVAHCAFGKRPLLRERMKHLRHGGVIRRVFEVLRILKLPAIWLVAHAASITGRNTMSRQAVNGIPLSPPILLPHSGKDVLADHG